MMIYDILSHISSYDVNVNVNSQFQAFLDRMITPQQSNVAMENLHLKGMFRCQIWLPEGNEPVFQ